MKCPMPELTCLSEELAGWDDPAKKIRDALREDRFLLLQQPILPLSEADPARCCEVLIRMKDEEANLLPPGGFFPFAEACGMMPSIDAWVVRTLIARCQGLQARLPDWRAPLLWINLSEAAVKSAEFVRSLHRQLQREGFEGRLLCFELAESTIASSPRETERLITALAPLGCKFAVDGFAGEATAHAELKDLRIDFLKIDGRLIHQMLRSPAALARVRAIEVVSRAMGVRTVAMLVEDDATLHALRSLGVDYAQGFGIARPQPLFSGVEDRVAL